MNKIIVMFENKDRELNISLYDFMNEQYLKAAPILVCHVTEEEYKNMKEQLQYGYLNERLSRMITQGDIGYNKFRYVVAYDTISHNLLVSDYEHPDKIGCYRIDNEMIYYDENGYQLTNLPVLTGFTSSFHDLKVYTTESYKDIIAHYKQKCNEMNYKKWV